METTSHTTDFGHITNFVVTDGSWFVGKTGLTLPYEMVPFGMSYTFSYDEAQALADIFPGTWVEDRDMIAAS